MYVADSPTRSAQLNASAAALSNQLLYQRSLQIVGANEALAARVRALLPEQNSNLWWLGHLRTIERLITADEHIASATVALCRDGWLPRIGCFSIEVKPRRTEFLVIAASDVRLVAADGVVLESVAAKDVEAEINRLVVAGTKAPRVVRGIYSDQPSSDVASARFARISAAVTQLEKQLTRRIEALTFLNSSELEVRIEALRFPVRFNLDPLTTLSDQADRFLRLEREIAGKTENIELVDMAFDKLGVVRYAQPLANLAAKTPAAPPARARPAKKPATAKKID